MLQLVIRVCTRLL